KLVAWLTLDEAERAPARSALARETARRYSWENVAKGVIAAAQGRLGELPFPAATAQNNAYVGEIGWGRATNISAIEEATGMVDVCRPTHFRRPLCIHLACDAHA